MAKKIKRKFRKVPASAFPPSVFPFGIMGPPPAPVQIEQRAVVSAKDGWSEYTLDDGTTLRIKAVIVDVKRAKNQHTPEGDPLYLMQIATITETRAPKKLRRATSASTPRKK